jgi:imidazolonepropionase-like amidohydrolase
MVQPDSFETLHARYDNAALLHEAGVKLAFRSGANHTSRNLRVDAGVTVAHGLPWEVAIRALTAGIGDVLGVPGRYGRLAVGAPATFFVSDGDPLQARSRVTQMWIDGRPVSLRNRQTELFERYRTL